MLINLNVCWLDYIFMEKQIKKITYSDIFALGKDLNKIATKNAKNIKLNITKQENKALEVYLYLTERIYLPEFYNEEQHIYMTCIPLVVNNINAFIQTNSRESRGIYFKNNKIQTDSDVFREPFKWCCQLWDDTRMEKCLSYMIKNKKYAVVHMIIVF